MVRDDPEAIPGSVTIRLPSYELPPSMNSKIVVPKGTKTIKEDRKKIEVRYVPVPVNVNQPWVPVVHHYGHGYTKKKAAKKEEKEEKKEEKKEEAKAPAAAAAPAAAPAAAAPAAAAPAEEKKEEAKAAASIA